MPTKTSLEYVRVTCTTSWLFQLFNLYNEAELSWNRIGRNGVQVETESTICCLCSRSPQNLKLTHFTLLFCRRRRKNVPKFITPVQGIVLLIKSYCFMTFSLPSSSNLLKLSIATVTATSEQIYFPLLKTYITQSAGLPLLLEVVTGLTTYLA